MADRAEYSDRMAPRTRAPRRAARQPKRVFVFRRVLVGVAGLIVLMIAFQLAWPANLLLPNQHVNGVDVGGKTVTEATALLDDGYRAQPIQLVDASDVPLFDVQLPSDATISADIVAQAAEYPIGLRLVPGSFFWRMTATTQASVHPSLSDADLPDVTRPPRDAELQADGGSLNVLPSQMGFQADGADGGLLARINELELSLDKPATLVVDGQTIPPAITTEAATKLRDSIMGNLGDGLKLTLAAQNTTLDPAVVLDMLSMDASGDALAATIDPDALRTALSDWASPLESKPTGVRDGVTVDWEATAKQLGAALSNADTANNPVALSTRVTNANQRSYSGDDAGLRQELADRFGNRPYAVSVIDLTGNGRDFSVNGDQVFTSASTYKVYVAYSMIHAIEQGSLTWSSPLNGTTLDTCFQRMIVNSDNGCPEAWLRRYGYPALTNQAHSIGATKSAFSPGNMRTTANDLAQTLAKLYRGQLANPTNSEKMIKTMSSQVYRSGIPTGIPDGTVADKVGFLNALLHDAGIVYSTRGDYVLVVMTDRSSWANIAAAASAVDVRR